eukprot:908075-Pyramimonas_sp.AAC.1
MTETFSQDSQTSINDRNERSPGKVRARPIEHFPCEECITSEQKLALGIGPFPGGMNFDPNAFPDPRDVDMGVSDSAWQPVGIAVGAGSAAAGSAGDAQLAPLAAASGLSWGILGASWGPLGPSWGAS